MPQPASIQKPNFDIVAWNDSFCRLMGIDFATLPEEDRNCIYLYLTHETGAAGSKIAMCCRPSSPISAPRWPSTAAIRRGKTNWRAFSPPRRSLKRCGISATRCAAWKTRLNILTTRSSGDSACSRCTGIRRRATLAPAGLPADGRGGRAGAGVAGPTLITGNQMAGNVPSSGIARPALLDGSLSLRGVGEGKHCREVLYVIYDFSTHCAPDTPSALCHSWRRERTGAPVAAAPVPRAPASNIAAARAFDLSLQASGRAEAASMQNTALSPHPCGLPRPAGNVSAMLRPQHRQFQSHKWVS